MKKLLYPLSVIYGFISTLNRMLTKRSRLNVPVISVGNVTWGGSGKTPVVLAIAEYVLSKGKMPVILSRGYARKDNTRKNIIVRDREKILSRIYEAGDEPYMMAQRVQCPVIVGKDRTESARLAQEFNPDVFILDDGFQHWKLERDLDIVCVNALNPFGNNMVIPAGILREKTTSLARAGIVVLTNSNLCADEKLESIKKKIISITGKKPLLSFVCNSDITDMYGNNKISADFFKNKDVVMVCAVGSPDNFKNMLANLGFSLKREIVFKDHHKYSLKDAANIASEAVNENTVVFTTHKDAVKLSDVADDYLKKKIYVLNISVCFQEGRDFMEQAVDKILSRGA
ncbi:MAG: tetraacyldisaccharide 4'-kinase [Endomicrobiaceae bacterium]|nr:tetraacyldisaccharide 4'-kinase [Endomicrobiaceae bacterium]